MKFRTCLFTFSIAAIISGSGCNFINPDEAAPTYIQIDTFTFDPGPTLPVTGPSNSTKIKDVWVYIDNTYLGTYEMPVRFPVLTSGNTKVTVVPGVLMNGISATHTPYPFYVPYEETLNLEANGTTHIAPSTEYYDDVICPYNEDFEGSGFSMISTGSSDTSMIQLSAGDPHIFEGNSSCAVYLSGNKNFFEVVTTTEYSLPGSGKPVYIELDYNINQVMQVGLFINLIGSVEQYPVINLNKTNGWNKIYIQIGGITTSYYQQAISYKVYLGAIKDAKVSLSEFYIDNLKVIYK